MADHLRQIISRNRAGEAVAIPSVCSAHFDVIRACLMRAQTVGHHIVIEATSNQVNQFGGYTGLTPEDFVSRVRSLAHHADLDPTGLIFGGDHLGPQAWRAQSVETAMAHAHQMVADYARAGFSKIHLDCSAGCAGEAAALPDEVTAERSAALARSCLEAAQNPDDLVFVIGTEVPPPGGATIDEAGDIPASDGAGVETTLMAHQRAFDAQGIGHAFTQVAGLVVQPGVEFSPMAIHHYPQTRDLPFRAILASWSGIGLEAHSTDYQKPPVFRRLAEQGFAFQKVGPALTFAWRQAVYAFDLIRASLTGVPPMLMAEMERLMIREPANWQDHYHGDAAAQALARHYGLADRIRYYWACDEAQQAVAALRQSVAGISLPDPVLLQFFDDKIVDRAETLQGPQYDRLVDASVQLALDPYLFNAEAA